MLAVKNENEFKSNNDIIYIVDKIRSIDYKLTELRKICGSTRITSKPRKYNYK